MGFRTTRYVGFNQINGSRRPGRVGAGGVGLPACGGGSDCIRVRIARLGFAQV